MSATHLVSILTAACDAAGYWHPARRGRPTDYDLFLFGLRAASDQLGAWDDAIGALRYVGGRPELYLWRGTTDPGREGAGGGRHARGVACLVPGQYRACWQVGTHKAGTASAHRALVQRGTPFRVWRDRTENGRIDRSGPVFADVRGLNCHRPYRDGLVAVGDASHGCQVLHRQHDHAVLMRLVDDQARAGLGQVVSYTLWDVGETPSLAPLLSEVA